MTPNSNRKRVALATASLLVPIAACSWMEFDDLKRATWVRLVDPDPRNLGDFATEVVAVPLSPGETGVRFVIAAGATRAGSGAGLAEATFDAAGELTNQVGHDALMGSGGPIAPLRAATTPVGLTAYSGESFVVGAPGLSSVIRYDGLMPGTVVGTLSDLPTGSAVAVGNLGLGSSQPDIVALTRRTGDLGGAVTVFPGSGTAAPVTCIMGSAINDGLDPVVSLSNVVIAPIDGDPARQQIVVSGKLDGEVRIFILDAAQIAAANGEPCPVAASFPVSGIPAPQALAVADIGGGPRLDLVTGTSDGMNTGLVRVYLDLERGVTPEEIPIPPPDHASALRGSRIVIGNIDVDVRPEIIIGDASASPDASAAGQVEILRFGATGCATPLGPACLVRTLYAGDARVRGYFGRDLALGSLKTSTGSYPVLAVARHNQLLVYYRVGAEVPDPRE